MAETKKQRKYTDEQYAEHPYFQGDDDGYSNHSQKLVVTRKEQECTGSLTDVHEIAKGSKVVKEVAIDPDSGWVSSYLCLDCADEYLDLAFGDD